MIFRKESPHHNILVYEDGPIRTLRLGEGPNDGKQSEIDLRNLGRHLLEYTRLSFAGLLFNQNPRHILVIGLGGGVIPRNMHYFFPETEIDVVDIDPDVLDVARKYFFFETDDKLRVHIMDGRIFVLNEAEKNPGKVFDMIVLDAYRSDNIPEHLITKEFHQQIAAILHPKGVVVSNVLTDRIFHSQVKTFLSVYGRSYVFMGRHAKNTIIVSPGPDVIHLTPKNALETAELLQEKHKFGFDLKSVAAQYKPRFKPKRGIKMLTDKHIPHYLI